MNNLGYGIVAYLRILRNMAILFAIFSVMLIPTISFYSNGREADKVLKGYESYMISNLGQSSVECEFSPISVGRITLQCPYGTVGKILDYGVNNINLGSPLDTCMNNDKIKHCKPNLESVLTKLQKAKGKDFYTAEIRKEDLWWDTRTIHSNC